MEFVLNRKHTLTGHGHVINFEKGQPTWVPPSLVKAAAAIGAEPVDGDKVDPLENEQTVNKEPEGQERLDAIFTAIDLIREKNDSKDFGGDNRPLVGALSKVLGFDITKKERDAAWPKYVEKMNAE